MTDHADISRRLALAIGWEPDQSKHHMESFYVADWPRKDNRATVLQRQDCYPVPFLPWKRFDYRDPAVIWPIAERFNCFPEKAWGSSHWCVERFEPIYQFTQTYTAALAVALAVIKAKESK